MKLAARFMNQLRKYTFVLFIGSVLCVFFFCMFHWYSTTEVMRRREKTILNLQDPLVRQKDPISEKIVTNLLIALTNASANSLIHPTLTSAFVIQRADRVGVHAHWIAKKPCADGLEVEVGDGLTPLRFAMDGYQLRLAEADRKNSVRFAAHFGVKRDEEGAKRLNSVETPERMRLRLLHGSDAVTDWFPMSIYDTRSGKLVAKESSR